MGAAYNGLHVVFVPPGVMATLPTAWLHMIHKHKASCVISSSRALSGCISLSNHKELKDLSLETVRMLLLDDGANPCEWEGRGEASSYSILVSHKRCILDVLVPIPYLP